MATKGVANTNDYVYKCIDCGVDVHRNRTGLTHVRCFPCKSELHRETQKYRYREIAARREKKPLPRKNK